MNFAIYNIAGRDREMLRRFTIARVHFGSWFYYMVYGNILRILADHKKFLAAFVARKVRFFFLGGIEAGSVRE